MSVSDWLLGTLCVLAFIIVIQVGMVWRILDNILNCVGWIKDIWRSVINIQSNIINIRDKLGARPSKWNVQEINMDHRETNMDHLKSITSSKEMSKILNNMPWCAAANGYICVKIPENWNECEECRIKWLDAPYEEET